MLKALNVKQLNLDLPHKKATRQVKIQTSFKNFVFWLLLIPELFNCCNMLFRYSSQIIILDTV